MNKQDAHNYVIMKKLVNRFCGEVKIRRGIVHAAICEALEIKLNNKNVQLIKKALEPYNPREVRIRGLQYYRFQ